MFKNTKSRSALFSLVLAVVFTLCTAPLSLAQKGGHSGGHSSGGSRSSGSRGSSQATRNTSDGSVHVKAYKIPTIKSSTRPSRTITTSTTSSLTRRSMACASCARDEHGRIKRSKEATRAFQRRNPCPSTGKTSGKCSGYVIDHVKPLALGGEDDPSNIQWQTKEAAKAKDKIERRH